MIYYELLVLLKPDILQESYDEIKGRITSLIEENGGVLKTYDRWGKYLLAYEVQKFSYGIYVLVRFGIEKDASKSLLEKLKNLCQVKFNTTIMRNVIVSLGKNYNEDYCRPDSLEDAPRRDKSSDEKWNFSKRSENDLNSVIGESNLDLDSVDDVIITESDN